MPQVIHRQGDPRAKDCQTNLHQIELSGGDDHQDGDDQDSYLYHSDDHDDDSSETRAGHAIATTVLVSLFEPVMKTSIIERCSVAKTKRWRRMLFPSHSRRSPNLVAAVA